MLDAFGPECIAEVLSVPPVSPFFNRPKIQEIGQGVTLTIHAGGFLR